MWPAVRLAGIAAGALTLLTACGSLMEMPPSSPDGPRISNLTFDPPESVAGCIVTLHLQFDAGDAEITGGRVRWWVAQGRRATSDGGTTLDPELFQGKASGEVTVAFRLRKVGHYRYLVQVEDSAGRRSNVLEQDLISTVAWAPGVIPCTP
jgi:hypothetical protein